MVLFISVFTACDNVSNNSTIEDTEITKITDPKPSIIGKWYYNSEDDRYYYQFLSNGKVYYRYYQNLGSPTSALNTFITVEGHWSYLNDEKTKFTVGWKDSVDRWYNIISEDDEKLVIASDPAGPAGSGLGSITNLLKSAKTVIFTVDSEITDLMGTWYYDETKDGKSINFQTDGICYYRYYQYYGEGTFSNLNRWVSQKGIWNYSSSSKVLSITMNGEVTYYYLIESLSKNNVKLVLRENNPAGKSMIYSNSVLYK